MRLRESQKRLARLETATANATGPDTVIFQIVDRVGDEVVEVGRIVCKHEDGREVSREKSGEIFRENRVEGGSPTVSPQR